MGTTSTQRKRDKLRKELQLKKERVPAVEVLTDEMRELAGLNTTTKMDFSSGTSGLRKEKSKDGAKRLLRG